MGYGCNIFNIQRFKAYLSTIIDLYDRHVVSYVISKRNAYPTAITQNVQYLLESVEASTMLSNSEFIVMLNQDTNDRLRLAELLNISDDQLSYIRDSKPGCGLIRYGSSLVPFENHFPNNTKLYKLMTTKPGE